MKDLTFLPTDFLLPTNVAQEKWAVLASDQYINEESYWQSVENIVGREPSTLRLTLPESCLDGPDIETDIMAVNNTMTQYLRQNIFDQHDDAMILVERKLKNGQTRLGVMGMIDLEKYDYSVKGKALVRASETILTSRIPPRVAARKNAPLEVTHVVLLADDEENFILENIPREKLKKLYDFSLMTEGGSLKGYLLEGENKELISSATAKLGDKDYFQNKYQTTKETLQLALGDGTHALATAKECYERQKKLVPPEEWSNLPSRYAMVELVNLHQEAVVLKPFHRVVSPCDPREFLRDFRVFVEQFPENDIPSQDFQYYFGEHEALLTVENPVAPIEMYTFENFLASQRAKGKNYTIDYTLSIEEGKKASQKKNTICIIFPELNKKQFFPSLIHHGILPKKTFALGEPLDKKYYYESRKIR
ncbi:MAG: DUF1015 domain-containing protein [Eubacteriales bacterium]